MSSGIFGLIGKSLVHSFSKEIHEAIGAYNFNMWEMTEGELDDFLRGKSFDGAMVTIPYKEKVISYLDSMSSEVEKLRVCNLILKGKEGNLLGHNTDIDGFLYMVKRTGMDLEGKKVLILGDGASSRTVNFALKNLQVKNVKIASRRAGKLSEDKKNEVVSKNGPGLDPIERVSYEEGYPEAEIIINTTPLGMYPNIGETPLNLKAYTKLLGVFDLIYNPLSTSLIMEAKDMGLVTANGLSMLVAQAVRGAELFLGGKLPGNKNAADLTEELLKNFNRKFTNIILIGMPGSGKSSLAEKIAKKENKIFVDTDKEIEREEGNKISDIFRQKGEKYFRQVELEMAKRVAKETGQVIATGGGIVLQEEAMKSLRQNGFILWVKRPLESLETKGRPLSTTREALEIMYELRRPLYEKYMDKEISFDQDLDSFDFDF